MVASSPFSRPPGSPLSYLEQGEGPVVVLVHGSLTDARSWHRSQQLDRLAATLRVLAPSRRLNYPHTSGEEPSYNASVDARDLVDFVRFHCSGPVHLLGHSYGAYAALLAAVREPGIVRSLVLAEPPLMRWLPLLARGEGVWESFERRVWIPMGTAFQEGGDESGLEATASWAFGRPLRELEPATRQELLESVSEWRSLTTTDDAFPFVPMAAVAGIAVPTLVLSGSKNAGSFHDIIDEALATTIPGALRTVVPGAGHEMFLDAPEFVAERLLRFWGVVDA